MDETKWRKYLDCDDESMHSTIREGLIKEKHSAPHHLKILADFIPKECKKILDVGCAGGYATHLLSTMGFDVTGMSINRKDIELLETHHLKGFLSDMHEIAVDDESFDLVFASHVLEHSIAPLIALTEFNRVLRQNGYALIAVPEWNGSVNNFPIKKFSHHLFCVPPEVIITLLDKAGFNTEFHIRIPEIVGSRTEYFHDVFLAKKVAKPTYNNSRIPGKEQK